MSIFGYLSKRGEKMSKDGVTAAVWELVTNAITAHPKALKSAHAGNLATLKTGI